MLHLIRTGSCAAPRMQRRAHGGPAWGGSQAREKDGGTVTMQAEKTSRGQERVRGGSPEDLLEEGGVEVEGHRAEAAGKVHTEEAAGPQEN